MSRKKEEKYHISRKKEEKYHISRKNPYDIGPPFQIFSGDMIFFLLFSGDMIFFLLFSRHMILVLPFRFFLEICNKYHMSRNNRKWDGGHVSYLQKKSEKVEQQIPYVHKHSERGSML
jgi:hypothetical protein